MASIVLELQKEALDEKIDIASLLRKVFLVSVKLNLIDLKEWAKNELDGYEEYNSLPKYRKIYGILKSFNPYHGWKNIEYENSDLEKTFTESPIFQSIAEIQKLTLSSTPALTKNLNAGQLKILKKAIGTSNEITLFIPVTAMEKIINSVRNTILDWALKLEQEGILGHGLEFNDTEKERAQMTKTTIRIENFQGVLGDVSNSEVIQNLDMKINKNDFNQLADFLAKNEVDTADISSLHAAIEDDGAVVTTNSGLGKQVSGWIGNMVSKSASGSWNVSIAAAGNLLSTAISKYYGF